MIQRKGFASCFALVVLLVAICLSGCIPDQLSWSPDGRYLSFVDSDSRTLWVWDTRTGEAAQLTGPGMKIRDDILFARYLPSDGKMLLGVGDFDDTELWTLDPKDPSKSQKIAADVSPFYGLSQDGRYLYYVKERERSQETDEAGKAEETEEREEDEENQEGKEGEQDEKDNNDGRYQVVEYDLKEHSEAVIFSTDSEIAFPTPDSSRSRFLVSGEDGLLLFDKNTRASRALYTRKDSDDMEVWWPTWVDDKSIVFAVFSDASGKEGNGELVRYSLADNSMKVLCEHVYAWHPLALSPDRKTVAVTYFTDVQEEIAQVATVDVVTSERKVLTDEPFSAGFAAFSPDGSRIAYMTPPEIENDSAAVRILDIETGRKSGVWRNEQERLLAAAESIADGGDVLQALAAYRDLFERFPDTPFADLVCYEMVRLNLDPAIMDVDEAFEAWEGKGLNAQIEKLFWRSEDKLATDPPEDWIQTYGTEESEKEYKFNTDLTRDLRGLWVRGGKERVYIRVDYGSNRDLQGVGFQDTVLMFDHETSAERSRPEITPSVHWEREHERLVLVRHWYEAGRNSQYDLEIRDRDGQIICRYLASGFTPSSNPVFDLVHTIQGDTSSVVYSISRNMLGLNGPRRVNLQVCTLKGGIESHEELERPRVGSVDGQTVCDVADTFGPENTTERINADLKKNVDPAAPAVIKGYAATFELE